MTGANSAVGLRSMPARYSFLDEVDAYPASADEEGDPVALAAGNAGHGGRVGPAQLLRPGLPARTMALGEDGEGGPSLERLTLGGSPRAEVLPIIVEAPDQLQRSQLETRDLTPVDEALLIERPALRPEARHGVTASGGGHRVDGDVQRIAPSARAGVVRARFRVRARVGRAERADGQEPGTDIGGPAAQRLEVRQVADAPAVPGAGGGQLDGPTPFAEVIGQVTAARAGDQQPLASVIGEKGVIAQRRIARHGVRPADCRSVLQRQLAASRKLPPGRDDGNGVRRIACAAHGGLDCPTDIGVDRAALTEGIGVGLLDPRKTHARAVRRRAPGAPAADGGGRPPSARRRGRSPHRRTRRVPR